MGIWAELGIFGIALAFGLWQIHDVKRAREHTRRQREHERAQAAEAAAKDGSDGKKAEPR